MIRLSKKYWNACKAIAARTLRERPLEEKLPAHAKKEKEERKKGSYSSSSSSQSSSKSSSSSSSISSSSSNIISSPTIHARSPRFAARLEAWPLFCNPIMTIHPAPLGVDGCFCHNSCGYKQQKVFIPSLPLPLGFPFCA